MGGYCAISRAEALERFEWIRTVTRREGLRCRRVWVRPSSERVWAHLAEVSGANGADGANGANRANRANEACGVPDVKG